uniref:F5/8 type C domain-containing protein n=1 Tax=Mesocestoides corti TaxID=53468 RepID=A0A5K3G4W2_MESCO
SDPSGGFIATVRVCEVENKIFLAFLGIEEFETFFNSYITVYFSHGGTWKNIDRNCIQPQRSSPMEIKAGGLDEVEIVCARRTTCRLDPITLMVDDRGIICRDFMSPRCS